MTVWPFIVSYSYDSGHSESNLTIQGFVHSPNRNYPMKPEDPFPSFDISTIRETLPTVEVEAVFHLPLSTIVDPTRQRLAMFREGKPYWAISVADLLRDDKHSINERKDDHIPDVVDNSKLEDGLEVWGLTGWYLSLFMKVLKI
jgi:nudix motif 8